MVAMSEPTSPSTPDFMSISPAEFFYRNRQMAGFGNPSVAVFSAVREMVENALDACEDARRAPVVRVDVHSLSHDRIEVTVADNGAGIPYEHVPEAFGRVLYGSKFATRQRRGTFGLGVSMAVLYGQITTDSPVIVHTRPPASTGRRYEILIDIEKNRPVVESVTDMLRPQEGTTVTVRLKGDLRNRDRIVQYLRLTSVGSPHARLGLTIDGSEVLDIGPATRVLPTPPVVTRPHPRAADLELLRRLVSTRPTTRLRDFLVSSFQQVGRQSVSRFVQFASLSPSRPVGTLSRDELAHLSDALQKYPGFGRPDASSLSPIGQEGFVRAVEQVFSASCVKYGARRPAEWHGNPFIVEGVVATGDSFPSSDVPQLYRFANRVPLLYDAGDDALQRTVKRIDWKRYGLGPDSRFAVFLHLCSTRIPYRAAGKQSVDTVPEIEAETTRLLRSLGRALSRVVERQARARHESRRRRSLLKHLRLIAKFSASLAGIDEPPDVRPLVDGLFEASDDD